MNSFRHIDEVSIYQWIQSDLSYTYVLLLLSRSYSVLPALNFYTHDGWKMCCEVILLRNEMMGEITECFLT